MWLNLLSLGVKTGAKLYQNKQRTKQLMSDAQMHHAEQMAKGEIEYKAKVIESNDNGWKDEFVLVLVSMPILILGYSIFSDDPDIRDKLDLFFQYFKELPYWYQAIFIGVVSAIYGLKGADIMRKKQYHVQMDKLKIDAVITDLELQVETSNNPYGSYVSFSFIDTYPYFTKVNEMVEEIKKRSDVDLINYEYTYKQIHKNTDLKYFDVTRNQGSKERAKLPQLFWVNSK